MGEDDEKSIMQEINLNIKKLFGRTMLTGGLALVSIIITVLVRLFPQAICSAVFFAPVAYAVINFLLIRFFNLCKQSINNERTYTAYAF